MTLRLLAIASLLAAALPAQSASFQTFGSGCALQRQTLAIGNTGLPILGQSFDVNYRGPNFTGNSAQQRLQPVLQVGLQATQFTIPQRVFRSQPMGCDIYTVPVLVLSMRPARQGAMYDSAATFRVPNDPQLTGASVYFQWLGIFEQCGFVGCDITAVGTSDAAIATFGT